MWFREKELFILLHIHFTIVIVHILYLNVLYTQHCRSTSSERETTETESLSCAMDTGEATVVEDSSDVEYSEDTTADDGNF